MASKPAVSEDSRSLFISNIDNRVSDSLLYELFYQAGPIESLTLQQRNRHPLGVVTYKHSESVPYAINIFGGTALFDRVLGISTFKPLDVVEVRGNPAVLTGRVHHVDGSQRYMEPRPRGHHRAEPPYDKRDRRNKVPRNVEDGFRQYERGCRNNRREERNYRNERHDQIPFSGRRNDHRGYHGQRGRY